MFKRITMIFLLAIFLLTACVDKDKDTDGTDNNSTDEKELTPTDKPVIYLYPVETMQVSVKLKYDGELLCTYPKYDNGWDVTAYPDGRIVNNRDQLEYAYLFWEGVDDYPFTLDTGFVVKGDETEAFLKDKLKQLGLTAREYNEFIVYWLPIMEKNPYNLVTFAGDEYNDLAELTIVPKPDSLLRVFMVFKSIEQPIEIKEQKLRSFDRKGFTVVEWGGKQIK